MIWTARLRFHFNSFGLQASIDSSARPQVRLFEFDTRFEVFKDYIPYDFQQPMRLPGMQSLMMLAYFG